MKTILRHAFNNGIFVKAYAPFLKPGEVTDCPAIIESNREDGLYHSYKGEATIEYNSADAFPVRLDNGQETFVSVGIVKAAHWSLDDELHPKEQTR